MENIACKKGEKQEPSRVVDKAQVGREATSLPLSLPVPTVPWGSDTHRAPCGASQSSAERIHPKPPQGNTAMSPAQPGWPGGTAAALQSQG